MLYINKEHLQRSESFKYHSPKQSLAQMLKSSLFATLLGSWIINISKHVVLYSIYLSVCIALTHGCQILNVDTIHCLDSHSWHVWLLEVHRKTHWGLFLYNSYQMNSTRKYAGFALHWCSDFSTSYRRSFHTVNEIFPAWYIVKQGYNQIWAYSVCTRKLIQSL